MVPIRPMAASGQRVTARSKKLEKRTSSVLPAHSEEVSSLNLSAPGKTHLPHLGQRSLTPLLVPISRKQVGEEAHEQGQPPGPAEEGQGRGDRP
jgi:hypothetical protein